jgi:hypothetical protein
MDVPVGWIMRYGYIGLFVFLMMGIVGVPLPEDLILEADGRYSLTDVITSGTVLFGLALVHLTGWLRLDVVIACIAGVNIVFWGFRLVRQAFTGLM